MNICKNAPKILKLYFKLNATNSAKYGINFMRKINNRKNTTNMKKNIKKVSINQLQYNLKNQ